MKYLKLFENHKNGEDIHRICNEYDIVNYTINDNLSIDVDYVVNLFSKGLTKLPLKFNKVNGRFSCFNNKLTSLEGAPNKVTGYFDCSHNKLTSLEGAPKEVNGDFDCSRNNLYSFYNLPIDVIGEVYYSNNPIECFENLVGQDSELIYEFNELYVIQKVEGEWSIYKHRMVEFVDMFETDQPDYDKIGKYYKILD
jgi:hypothetical protein